MSDLHSPSPTPQTAALPRAVIVGLLVTILLDTLIQMTWKYTLCALGPTPEFSLHSLTSLLHTAGLYLLLVLFVLQFFNWMAVLGKTDLTFAQPITALSYITLALGSYIFLGEPVGLLRSAGIALILAGVWLVSGTPHRTTRPVDPTSMQGASR